LRAKYVFFEEMFDFVVHDSTEDLHDGHALVSDLEISASAIAILGFGSAATLFDVVIVARNGGGHCRSGAKYVFFEEMFDFVIHDSTEDLQDGHALVSDLKIHASAIAILGFGSAATLFDVVIVVRNGGRHCRYGSKICFF
jgi:hypothetical protein